MGFDFIAVSQYLTEQPKKIAEKIVQSKGKRFADTKLFDSDDYDEFLNFWIYGNREKLREITVDYEFWKLREEWESKRKIGWQDSRDRNEVERLNKFTVCWEVMERLDFRGLQEAIQALERAEAMGENALSADENQLFEGIAQIFAANKLDA